MGYTLKCMKKWRKSGFTGTAIISKLNKFLDSKFETTILKPIYKLSLNFKFVSSELIEK